MNTIEEYRNKIQQIKAKIKQSDSIRECASLNQEIQELHDECLEKIQNKEIKLNINPIKIKITLNKEVDYDIYEDLEEYVLYDYIVNNEGKSLEDLIRKAALSYTDDYWGDNEINYKIVDGRD